MSYLAKAADILGEMPGSEETAVIQLQQFAVDAGYEYLSDIEDIESLVDALLLNAGESPLARPNPFKRIGDLVPVDQWHTLDDMKQLGALGRELGWIIQERVMYYSLIYGGRVIMKMHGVRPTRDGNLSFRLMVPRMHTYEDLESWLDQMGLLQFKDREWIVGSGLCEIGKEILGRYFTFEELYVFLENISQRIENDKETAKMAGLKFNESQGSGDEPDSDPE